MKAELFQLGQKHKALEGEGAHKELEHRVVSDSRRTKAETIVPLPKAHLLDRAQLILHNILSVRVLLFRGYST